MTCRELAELLIDFVAGELPPDMADHVKHHLNVCPPCVTYLHTYQITIKLTRSLPPAPLPPELEKRLQAALKEAERGPSEGQA